ncbi:competence type IV pilus major pilin ComGC [Chloroflexota bacterium]
MKKLVRKFRKQFRHGEKGFTLIELLVVVAILGVLAAVIVPNIGSFFGTGEQQAADTELHNVQTAVIAYMADNSGALPTADGNPGAVSGAVDDFLVGGITDVGYGTYSVAADGEVSTTWTP